MLFLRPFWAPLKLKLVLLNLSNSPLDKRCLQFEQYYYFQRLIRQNSLRKFTWSRCSSKSPREGYLMVDQFLWKTGKIVVLLETVVQNKFLYEIRRINWLNHTILTSIFNKICTNNKCPIYLKTWVQNWVSLHLFGIRILSYPKF